MSDNHSNGSRVLYNTLLILVGAISIAVTVFAVAGIINTLELDLFGPSGNPTESTPSLQNPTDSLPTETQPTDSQPTEPQPTNPLPTPPAPTEPIPPTMPGYNVDAVAALVKEADFIAAGYDYAKAISMLESYEGYQEISVLTDRIAQYREADSKLVVYAKPETVTHIFFHSLIVDTDRAFDGDHDSESYHTYMTTVDEFNAMMEEMYKRGYVLITPYDLAYEVIDENGNASFKYGEIRLPEGKIPFIMSQDDLNYYSYMIASYNGENGTPYWNDAGNDGFASKIVIGEDGFPTCEYVDAQGKVHYGDYDLVPCLETFIQNHPDFSYHGARAVLGVTGYEGVFGYRTKPGFNVQNGGTLDMDSWNKEVEDAKAVAQCLKDHGWIIASHSYGHPKYGDISASAVKADSTKWENTVQPIVGDTDIILYPHGSDIQSWRKYDTSDAKFQALYEHGYRYFFNVDGNDYWNQLNPTCFRGGRRNLDGYRMYHNPDMLDDLFDVADVWDKNRPTTAPHK